MLNFKPQKGKAFDKLPIKTLSVFPKTKYLASIKYDGNQIFIVKHEHSVRFFTSDWKEFRISIVAELLEQVQGNFVIVGEFLHNCEGKLGDRRLSAILTTYRTNFNKGISNDIEDELGTKVMVFDFLQIVGNSLYCDASYEQRLKNADLVLGQFNRLEVVDTMLISGSQAEALARSYVNDGWEGIMLVEPDTEYQIGKRVNHSIKLKYRKTADLLCIDVEEGEGKYEGMIGALVLQDSQGRRVSVGSGLLDSDRHWNNRVDFIGSIVEIEYEQLMDTYIQPTFSCLREYKHESD